MARSSFLNQISSLALYPFYLIWYTSLPLVFLWDTILFTSYSWLSSVTIGSRGPYWVPPGKYGRNKLIYKSLCIPLTFPVSYNLYITFSTQLRTSNGQIKYYFSLEKPGTLKFLVDNKTLSPTGNSTTLWYLL